MMTVLELINHLKRFALDDLVVLAKDAKGSGFTPLESAEFGAYKGEPSKGRGEVGLRPEHLTQKRIDEGYSSEDVIEDGVNACVLWPLQ